MRRIRWQTVIHGLIVTLAITSGWGCSLSQPTVRGQSPATAEEDHPWPYTQAWYQQRAAEPPGVRQFEKHGKLWPPFPRSTGPDQTFTQAFHSARYWPYPYDCQDRGDVHALLDAQASAGWVLATTLHDYHFDPDTQRLTDAGRTQLTYIVRNVPPQYRTVYVAQGLTADMGQLRTGAVDEFLRETGSPNLPAVVTIPDTFAGRPANEVDRLRNLELQSIPRPRLFLIGVAGRQGSGGGSGAGPSSGGGSSGSGGGTGSTTTQSQR